MSWIGTFSGLKFDVLNPDPDAICLMDIAVALSRMPRFAGHTREFYSVAQHSVHVADICPQYEMEALMHDATEAYLIDLPRPIKALLPEYKAIEENLLRVIGEKFGFTTPQPPEVKEADKIMLETEHRDLMPATPKWDIKWATPVSWKVRPWEADVAALKFYQKFKNVRERQQVAQET